MAIPMILPIAGQGMVPVFPGKRLVMCQGCDDGYEIPVQCLPVPAFGFALVVAPELTGLLNRPH